MVFCLKMALNFIDESIISCSGAFSSAMGLKKMFLSTRPLSSKESNEDC